MSRLNVTWQELAQINKEQQDTLIATSERIRQELIKFQAVVDKRVRIALERESRLGFIVMHLQKMITDHHKLGLPGRNPGIIGPPIGNGTSVLL